MHSILNNDAELKEKIFGRKPENDIFTKDTDKSVFERQEALKREKERMLQQEQMRTEGEFDSNESSDDE